jgi:hypothetical protein
MSDLNKKPRVAFTIADENNLQYLNAFNKSLRKFHTEEELPLILIGPEQLKKITDPMKFYKMTPLIAKELLQQYETVIKFDVDQIVTGDLSGLWNGDFNVAVVQNSNPREVKTYPVGVWDINPMIYVNAGLVSMKSQEFVDHWFALCQSPHFDRYQFKEQDLLNILVYYGNYKIKFMDHGDSFYGLASKQYWVNVILRDDKLVLPQSTEWPTDQDKYIKVIHWAGGNQPGKMNYRLFFKPEVCQKIETLIN